MNSALYIDGEKLVEFFNRFFFAIAVEQVQIFKVGEVFAQHFAILVERLHEQAPLRRTDDAQHNAHRFLVRAQAKQHVRVLHVAQRRKVAFGGTQPRECFTLRHLDNFIAALHDIETIRIRSLLSGVLQDRAQTSHDLRTQRLNPLCPLQAECLRCVDGLHSRFSGHFDLLAT